MEISAKTDGARKWPPRLRREKACQYLEEVHGVKRKPATLAGYAVRGGGPAFERDGIYPLYRPENLDAWVNTILSPIQRSTSDVPSQGAA